MRFEVEGKPAIEGPSERKIRSAILALRSYGPSSFANLTDTNGNYLQVGGGNMSCLLERRDARTGRHFRGYHDKPSKVFPDGTILAFARNRIRMAANEWFDSRVVADIFVAFLRGDELPASVKWRDVTEMLKAPVSGRLPPEAGMP
jgi:hypothetical protein